MKVTIPLTLAQICKESLIKCQDFESAAKLIDFIKESITIDIESTNIESNQDKLLNPEDLNNPDEDICKDIPIQDMIKDSRVGAFRSYSDY